MVRTSATRAAAAAGLAVSLLAAGCGVPIPDATPPATSTEGRPGGGERVDRLEPVDVRSTELTAALRTLSARIDEARMLVAAEQDAVGVLLGVAGGGAAPSVLPTITPDRAGTATDDSGSIDGSCGTLWECWDEDAPTDSGGSCGKCVVTVLEGMANLSEASSREKNTIKKANKKLGGKLDEANCRLACQAIVKGPVKIQPKGK